MYISMYVTKNIIQNIIIVITTCGEILQFEIVIKIYCTVVRITCRSGS